MAINKSVFRKRIVFFSVLQLPDHRTPGGCTEQREFMPGNHGPSSIAPHVALCNSAFAMGSTSAKKENANSGTPQIAGVSRTPIPAQHQVAYLRQKGTPKRELEAITTPSIPDSIGTPMTASRQFTQ
jgi:hypothetical protein